VCGLLGPMGRGRCALRTVEDMVRALTGGVTRAVVRVPMGVGMTMRPQGPWRVAVLDTTSVGPAGRLVAMGRAGGRVVPVLRRPPDASVGRAVDVIRAVPRLVRHGRREARGEVAGQQQNARTWTARRCHAWTVGRRAPHYHEPGHSRVDCGA